MGRSSNWAPIPNASYVLPGYWRATDRMYASGKMRFSGQGYKDHDPECGALSLARAALPLAA